MREFRFSLAWLIGLVCAVGVVLGASLYRNPAAAASVVGFTVLALCVATLAGIFGSEPTRGRWLPFAVSAWCYLVASFSYLYYSSAGWYAARWLAGHSTAAAAFQPTHQSVDALTALLVGFLGTAAWQGYWKMYELSRERNKSGGLL